MSIRLLVVAAALWVGSGSATGQEASARLRFDRLSLQDGLSQSTATCVLQDTRGFLWVGTEEGLNRYDGYRFTTFKPIPGDSSSLSGPQVWALHEDPDGTLWIGTYSGLNRFDRLTETFTRFGHDSTDPTSLSNDFVRVIHRDRRGTLWIGTKNGLNRMIVSTDGIRFASYHHDPGDPDSLADSYVRAILEDSSGNLWIGTHGGGLDRFDRQAERFSHHHHQAGDPTSLSSNDVRALLEDPTGGIWVGSNTGGLNRLDPATGKVVRYPFDRGDSIGLSSNSVMALSRDATGHLWVATFDGGLNRVDPSTGEALVARHDPTDPSSLSADCVWSVLVDRSGLVWAGTSHGLSKLDPLRARLAHYSAGPGEAPDVRSVRALLEDHEGEVWVGTRAGLRRLVGDRIEPVDDRLMVEGHIRALLEDSHGALWVGGDPGLRVIGRDRSRATRVDLGAGGAGPASARRVWALLEDSDRSVWVGTEGGLFEIKADPPPSTASWRPGVRDRSGPRIEEHLGGVHIRVIYQDRRGELWIGTHSAGLFRRDLSTGNWLAVGAESPGSGGLSSPTVSSVIRDHRGVLWVGTYGGGLNWLEPGRSQFGHLTEADGLPDSVIYGILEASSGQIWLSTNRGLSRLDAAPGPGRTIRNYSMRDGLQSLEFNTGAYLACRDGRFLFGGINGINAFRPEEVHDNQVAPRVVLTELRVFNQEVTPGRRIGGRVPLANAISEARRVTLGHRDNMVSLEFAALHFADPERNHYAYRMIGADTEWNLVGTRHSATYSHLQPGRYTFEVRAANADEVWSEQPTTLEIVILPPFWKTWWFRFLMITMLVGTLFSGHQIRTRNIRRRAAELETLNLNLSEQIAVRTRTETEKDRLLFELRRLHRELEEAYETTLEGWARILELRDQDTEGHTRRVTAMTDHLAAAVGLSEAERVHVRRGAILHDIGKIALPDTLLRKREPLTDDEKAAIREHPAFARRFLESVEFLRPAVAIPYSHHERWDGSGYPEGLAGEEIPLAARIFAVVDVWDALLSDRPYREGWPQSAVSAYLFEQAGTHFDPRVVEVFLDLIGKRAAAGDGKVGQGS